MSESKRRVEKAAILDRIQLLAEEILNLTPPEALSLSVEYFRFMALKAANDTDGLPSKLAPSALVDQLWHTHLLDTRSYAELERLLLQNGGRLHHNPIRDEQPDYDDRLEYTRLLYSDTYHSAPPPDTWGALLLHDIDSGTALEGKDITIEVCFKEGRKVRVVVTPTHTTEQEVIEACIFAFKLPRVKHIHYALRYHMQSIGDTIPYYLEDNDQVNLFEEQLGC